MGYLLAAVEGGERIVPAGRRAPFGWGVAKPPLTLRFAGNDGDSERWLRVTVGVSLRTCVRVGVVAAESGRLLGELDIRYAPGLQTFELALPESVGEEGVELRMLEGEEAWFLDGMSTGDAEIPPVLRPHLFDGAADADRREAFLSQMASLACVQEFGWMEGCVLDGQLDLHACFPQRGFERAARQHADLFLKDDGTLTFENMRSEPEENQLKTIEETLMFASTARVKPGHPSMEICRRFWEQRHEQFGLVTDPGMPSAEGCYTVGYPLAMVGKLLGVQKYQDWAIHELRVRRDRLVKDGDIWLRSYDDGRRTFKNWSRGVAWYFLGIVKTLALLEDRSDIDDLRNDARRVAEFVLARRNERGIWGGFVGENDVATDTAGSSGIAAALAFAARHGLLGDDALAAARQAVDRLTEHLTTDGLLRGVSQTNRGGEAMQRSNYRVIFPMGMGLLAQAIAWTN